MLKQERYLGKVFRVLRRQCYICRVFGVRGRVEIRARHIQEGYLGSAFARRVPADLIPGRNVRSRQAEYSPKRFQGWSWREETLTAVVVRFEL